MKARENHEKDEKIEKINKIDEKKKRFSVSSGGGSHASLAAYIFIRKLKVT